MRHLVVGRGVRQAEPSPGPRDYAATRQRMRFVGSGPWCYAVDAVALVVTFAAVLTHSHLATATPPALDGSAALILTSLLVLAGTHMVLPVGERRGARGARRLLGRGMAASAAIGTLGAAWPAPPGVLGALLAALSATSLGALAQLGGGVSQEIGAEVRPGEGGLSHTDGERLLGRRIPRGLADDASGLVTGQRVLITGAGGSIGAELALQVSRLRPAELFLLDHDETHLHDVLAYAAGTPTALLADIRDKDRMSSLFAAYRPDVVFHAAAHKHVPLLERAPTEAFRTNVLGTRNVVEASTAAGAGTFVLVSTDKAVRPSSVMGATKHLAEALVLGAARDAGVPYSVVRFGNVLGSRGSVVPTFARQIAYGGPLTLTDPRMTRYFMTVAEAVELVLAAASCNESGVFALDMGQPVRMVDLVTRMVQLSGRRIGVDLELRITGPRPGEKLHEELVAPDERGEATAHPRVTKLTSTPIASAALRRTIWRLTDLADHRHEDELSALLLDVANGHPPTATVPAARTATHDGGAGAGAAAVPVPHGVRG
jgi:nucleoside-diphosphate-sugar epimerase